MFSRNSIKLFMTFISMMLSSFILQHTIFECLTFKTVITDQQPVMNTPLLASGSAPLPVIILLPCANAVLTLHCLSVTLGDSSLVDRMHNYRVTMSDYMQTNTQVTMPGFEQELKCDSDQVPRHEHEVTSDSELELDQKLKHDHVLVNGVYSGVDHFYGHVSHVQVSSSHLELDQKLKHDHMLVNGV